MNAQGGPPFITDDPATPGNRQWEINLGLVGNHNPAHSSYQAPNIDFNYGWGDRIQLMYAPSLAVATDENQTVELYRRGVRGIAWHRLWLAGHPNGVVPSPRSFCVSICLWSQGCRLQAGHASCSKATGAARESPFPTGK